MAEISARGKVLLGYSPPSLSNTQSRSSDVDFSDVFGGPPRRSGTTEESYSERNSVDLQCFNNYNDVEDDQSGTRLEKPVFGEGIGMRRRYTSDDFFDDIFRGDQPSSSSQSPRAVPRRTMFASAPGSRVMSPSRSLPPTEPFAPPANFSLPGCLTNIDLIASKAMSESFFCPSLSRFNQTIQKNDDLGNRSSLQSSVMPHHDCNDVRVSTRGVQFEEMMDETDFHSNAKGSEIPIYASNFHFSIHNWASKGVPLVISLRKKTPISKEGNKLSQGISGNERRVDHDMLVIDILSPNDTFVTHPSTEINKICEDNSFYDPEDAKEAHNITKENTNLPKSISKGNKFNTKPLSSFLDDANEVIIKKTGVKEKEKQYPVCDVSRHKFNKAKARKSSTTTENVTDRSEGTKKVKDFVNILNQESPSQTHGPGIRKSHSRRKKDTKNIKFDYEIKFSSARMNNDTEASYVNWGEEWPDTSEMEDQLLSNNLKFELSDTTGQTSAEAPNVNNLTASTSASNGNVAAIYDDQIYADKVSQWSKGKEGNIRALLSTLQYVLWQDSGWKSIPLVDIIEANAVKRAYQKALLRLHPDKLQQKGVAPHHKFIAEKVFDVLQEAWDQFNSLG